MSSLPGTRLHCLANGLTIVAEPMPNKQAAAWTFLIPAGSATEPIPGSTSVLESVSYLGAGSRNSRELSEALDDLGVSRSGGADVEYTTYGGGTLGLYLQEALPIYADIIRRPKFPEAEWEAQRTLALEALKGLDDAPARKMFQHLRRAYFTNGYGASSMGTEAGLNSLTLESLKSDHAARIRPEGAILALGGSIDFDAVVAQVEDLFGDWTGSAPELEPPAVVQDPVFLHLQQETAQMQIGIAYAGVTSTDVDFYSYRVANSVLSGGMGARLFTEVREKRGLVYSVSAGAHSHRGVGFTLAYAGTQPDRAQESLDVLVGELKRMEEGVSEAEVERAKIGMLSSLVMAEESSRSRTGGIARDMWMLGRVRDLDEVTAKINAVTPATIAEFYERHPVENLSVVTLGPRELQKNW